MNEAGALTRIAGPVKAFRLRFAGILLLLAFSVGACGQDPGDYFPLDKGFTWVYRESLVTRNKGNAGGLQKNAFVAVATNLAPQATGKAKAVPRLYADGRTLYFERTDAGVSLVATRAANDGTPAEIQARRLIKFPLKVGASWTDEAETQILKRTYLSGYGAVSKPIAAAGPMVFTIESLDDTVRVPAGRFRHCLRIHGVGSAKLVWGEPYGMIDVTLETTRWYAPGIGLVKRVRKEGTGPDGPLGAELNEELEAAKQPGWFR